MNSTINKMKVRAFTVMAMILSFMFLPTFEADATHIVGGELTYRVVGFQQVEIMLTVRRDCDNGDPEADFDQPAYFRVFDQNGQPIQPGLIGDLDGMAGVEIVLGPNDTLSEPFMSGCETDTFNRVCVQEATYRRIINLRQDIAAISEYKIVFQRCCRNTTLTNIVDPLEAGMTLEVDISRDELIRRNQSAVFPEFPPIYACILSTQCSLEGRQSASVNNNKSYFAASIPLLKAYFFPRIERSSFA